MASDKLTDGKLGTVAEREYGGAGYRLAQAREGAGIQQKDLAAIGGVDGSTLSRWEKGERGANRIDQFCACVTWLVRRTGHSFAWFIQGAGAEGPARNIDAAAAFARVCNFSEAAIELVIQADQDNGKADARAYFAAMEARHLKRIKQLQTADPSDLRTPR